VEFAGNDDGAEVRLRAAIVALALAVPAIADVVDSGAGGFTVKVALVLKAAPDVAYRKFVQNIGDWWNSQHTFSGDAHNLTMDARAGGCLCEKLPNDGGVRHMTVTTVMPGKTIVMQGALGPLQSVAATGSMQVQFVPGDGGSSTRMELTYSVTGYLPKGMNTWAAPVDSVLTEQFTRFQSFVERGSPTAK